MKKGFKKRNIAYVFIHMFSSLKTF